MFTIIKGGSIISRPEDTKDRYLSIRTVIELAETFEVLDDVFSTHFARYGLSRAKFSALVQLHMAGDRGLTQSELGKKMLVSRANITGLIERLEKEGLVLRQEDPSDKRAFRVCLTDRAAALMEAFLPVHNDYMHRAMSALDSAEKEALISLLEKLKKGLESL
ncbi:MAG: MarR family winged helix-turn-helix transcriptional regulator [Bacillota bacterium]